eukprot:UN16871
MSFFPRPVISITFFSNKLLVICLFLKKNTQIPR